MKLGSTKAAYTICYGLTPYFKETLDQHINKCTHYVVCFDESLNKIGQKGQMDIHIRYFNEDKKQVETRYFASVFMHHSSAEHILEKFLEGLGIY